MLAWLPKTLRHKFNQYGKSGKTPFMFYIDLD